MLQFISDTVRQRCSKIHGSNGVSPGFSHPIIANPNTIVAHTADCRNPLWCPEDGKTIPHIHGDGSGWMLNT